MLKRPVGGLVISIHALREEGDWNTKARYRVCKGFLSTPSARRATICGCSVISALTDFYPRPPRGGRPVLFRICAVLCNFYPRPPRGGRLCDFGLVPVVFLFLSTPSARRATAYTVAAFPAIFISIHALREEGDRNHHTSRYPPPYFYPRPPRGGRLRLKRWAQKKAMISIHALREEGDWLLPVHRCISADFYPRPPRGGRRTSIAATTRLGDFYPRPPRGGRLGDRSHQTAAANFYPRPPRGGRRRRARQCRCIYKFLSTPSARRATAADGVCDDRDVFLSTPSARRATCSPRGFWRRRS